MELRSDLNDKGLTETIRCLVEENYDLGELTRVKEVLGGYCHKSYAVWISTAHRTRRYFLRLYNHSVIENEIWFEHALLNHLKSNGFTLAAAIVPCRSGSTVIHTPPPNKHLGSKALWTLFEFLDGEDRYSWTHTDLTDNEFTSAAEVLALLHHCGHGFKKPPGADRVQPPIMEFIPTLKHTFTTFSKQAGDRRCDRLFKDNFKRICKALDDAASLAILFQGMKKLPIHCDYHPGNLKFRGEKCVGLFDFDWSKVDYRLFDVALGLVYFTSIWDDRATGLRSDKFNLFLSTYNEACCQFDHIDPLTKQERRYLVPMLTIANLFVLNWDLVDFYETPDRNDDEYYLYFHHNIGLVLWLAHHLDELEKWVSSTCS